MARHRRFCDRAGFTRHCWECANARGWEGELARCEAYGGRPVAKYDTPNNGCSAARGCCDYETEGK